MIMKQTKKIILIMVEDQNFMGTLSNQSNKIRKGLEIFKKNEYKNRDLFLLQITLMIKILLKL